MNRMFFAQGDRYLDFVVTKVKPIEELKCVLYELSHLPSGAIVMHIACDDPENLFSIAFKTLPTSSNGVAHILEHAVLCGSRRFPVKDPFFSMQKRSLNTFMNALTGSDFTCYPAASQVEKDFYNLLDVYCDAVFHPLLRKSSFLQEGHRLEFSQPNDPKSPLKIKGIVFNEMKGAMASPDARLWHAMLAMLVPDLPYAFNSGGDPKEIPNLTYAELVAFHETYYHPSHTLFFFYGNFSLKKHLDFISEKVLKHVSKLPPLPSIQRQKRRKTTLRKEISYSASEGEEGITTVALGWLTFPLVDQEDVLALQLLDIILMETDASPLKHRLQSSGLCVQADAHSDVEMSEIPYFIACKGCKPQNADLIEKLILDSLKDIAAMNIPLSTIEAAMQQMELSRLEITGNNSPFGLTLFLRAALSKFHGCEPEFFLVIHSLFERLRQRVQDPQFLPSFIHKTLIDNMHRARVVVRPDSMLASKEAQEEKAYIGAIQKKLTQANVQEILTQTQEVKDYQRSSKEQSLDCLPTINLSDIPHASRDFPLKHHEVPPLHIYHHSCFTNHLLYADLVFDVPEVAEKDLPYLHLFASILTEVGAGPRTYLENLEYMQAHTGGVSASFSSHFQVHHPDHAKPAFVLSGKALDRKMDKLFLLMRDMLLHPRFDEKERITSLVQQTRVRLKQRLVHNALRYAIHLALSGINQAGHIAERWQGLSYLAHIERLAQENGNALVKKLIAIKQQLFSFQNTHLILSAEKDLLPVLDAHKYYELPTLPSKTHPLWHPRYALTPVVSQGRIIPSPVAFTVQAFPTRTYLHPHAPALTVLALLLDNLELHTKIREEGGAYGCGATYFSSGSFYFYSYRDPVIASTLSTFRNSVEKVVSNKFTQGDLDAAKLGVIQHMDTPIAPSKRAQLAYSWMRDGKTLELRQRFREQILGLTTQAVRKVAEEELLAQLSKSVTVTFANKALLERENKLLKTPLPLENI